LHYSQLGWANGWAFGPINVISIQPKGDSSDSRKKSNESKSFRTRQARFSRMNQKSKVPSFLSFLGKST